MSPRPVDLRSVDFPPRTLLWRAIIAWGVGVVALVVTDVFVSGHHPKAPWGVAIVALIVLESMDGLRKRRETRAEADLSDAERPPDRQMPDNSGS